MAGDGIIAVTGASRGIGSAIVRELAGRGHTVGCLSRKGIGPEDREIPPEMAARFINLPCDMLDHGSVRQAVADLATEAGGIRALVNNAGLYADGKSHEFPVEEFERVLATNVTGAFVASQAVYPYLIENGGGTIINLGSFFGKLGVKFAVAYAVSKAAIASLTRCLATEWAKQKIRVIDVAPGFVTTDLNKTYMERESFRKFLQERIPTGEPTTPEDVARLIALLLENDLPNLTGETIYMDGGQGMQQ